jgi:hypothetical protein
MATGSERPLRIIVPTLAPSSCHRKQASLSMNDKEDATGGDRTLAAATRLFISF